MIIIVVLGIVILIKDVPYDIDEILRVMAMFMGLFLCIGSAIGVFGCVYCVFGGTAYFAPPVREFIDKL